MLTVQRCVQIRLGDKLINDKENLQKCTLKPNFFKCYEMVTQLPGASQLDVSVYDYDRFGADELIGSTFVDLEDRWFSPEWQNFERNHNITTSLGVRKPLERRHLWVPTASQPQGSLRMWVDVLPAKEARRYPVENIAPPQPTDFEVSPALCPAPCALRAALDIDLRYVVAGRHAGSHRDLVRQEDTTRRYPDQHV